MRIYTSCYTELPYLDKNIVPVSISHMPPRGYTGLTLPELSPRGKDGSKRGVVTGFGIPETDNTYQTEILDNISVIAIMRHLEHITCGSDVVLVCFEKSRTQCHRHLVAKWLVDAGYGPVIELHRNHTIDTHLEEK